MADSKITALTSISTSSDPANDPLVIVDVSDTSMAATGTTKKVTLNQLLACSPTATLASATITGALTVNGSGRFQAAGTNWMEFGVNVLTSNQSTGANIRSVVSSAANPTYSWTGDSDTGLFTDTANSIGFAIGGSEGMRLNANGLGVGGSPSAWATGYTAIQNRQTAWWSSASRDFHIGANVYYNGTDELYIGTAQASKYQQYQAAHYWYSAPSGTAGTAITFTRAMTLDASGNLLLATTTNTPSARQYINQASGSNPALYIAGGASTTPLINFNGAGLMRSDGQYLVMETTNASGTIYITANTNGVYLSPGGTSWTANSDERLKDIIEPISNAVEKVGSLRSVIGKFKNDETNTRRSFLIAQDVQAVFPEAVDASNPDKLGVAYTEVIPLLVAAIKELTAEVNALKKA